IKRGAAPSLHPPALRQQYNIWLDVVITPETPISIGAVVKIIRLKPTNRNTYDDAPTRYTAETTGVEGRVLEMRMVEAEVLELLVSNDNKRSSIDFAHLAIKYAPGLTVKMGWTTRLRLAILSSMLNSARTIPL
ncbi:hypothetical protein C2E23DRAFT_693013, partial [Lenzites betulinus]